MSTGSWEHDDIACSSASQSDAVMPSSAKKPTFAPAPAGLECSAEEEAFFLALTSEDDSGDSPAGESPALPPAFPASGLGSATVGVGAVSFL